MGNAGRVLILVLVAAVSAGCVSKGKYDQLLDHNRRLQAQLDDCNAEKSRLEADMKALQEQYERERRLSETLTKSLEGQKAVYDEMKKELTGVPGVKVEEGKVTVEDYVLFDPGKANIKKAGLEVLKKVAKVVVKRGAHVRIDGHTDSDPIRKSGWKSNHELSAQRALSVFHVLRDEGVPESHMFIVGWGPNRPRASNDTPEGKQLNRRVEIYLLPGEMGAVAPGGKGAPAKKPPAPAPKQSKPKATPKPAPATPKPKPKRTKT